MQKLPYFIIIMFLKRNVFELNCTFNIILLAMTDLFDFIK